MAQAPTGRERALIVAQAFAFLALAAFILSQGAGGAPAVLVAGGVAAGLVAFVRWSDHKEEGLRRRLADRGAWGAPAQGISPRIGRGVLLANQEGIAWVVAGAPPVVAGWDEVSSAKLAHLGQAGLRGLIRRFPPVPGARIDIAVAGGDESSFWLTSPSATSLEAWSASCPPMRALLGGRPAVDVGPDPLSPPPHSLEALVGEVGVPFLRRVR
jgi:hypothetical protein